MALEVSALVDLAPLDGCEVAERRPPASGESLGAVDRDEQCSAVIKARADQATVAVPDGD